MGSSSSARVFGFRLGLGLVFTWLAIGGVMACGDGRKPQQPAPTEPMVACASDDECEGQRCDPFTGCVPCLFDADCGSSARCVEETCHAVVACAADEDCESGHCDVTAGRCAECGSDTDCAAAQRCSDAVCLDFTACSTDADCAAGERCSGKQQRCVGCLSDADCGSDAACREGKCLARCEANDDCPLVYHCAKAVCALDICEAGQSSCSSTRSATTLCSDAGDAFDLLPCGSGRSCVASEGSAACQKLACAPGAWACDEAYQQAELCSADGLEVARIVDCTADGLVCHEGACVAKVCEPETQRCLGDALVTCSASGAAELSSPCADDERCDAEATECVARACQPGAAGCLEETLAICNREGSEYVASGEDCAASDMACWDGACAAVVCGAGFSCVDGDSFECTANRTALTLAETCNFENGQFCDAESGQCQDFACQPGQPTCNGDLATSCANDGSHALDVGVDCTATNRVCWAAECLPPICEEGSYACEGSELKRCVNKGTVFHPSKTCGENTVCDAAAGTCRLQRCVPNQPACDGSLATMCDVTGLGYTGDSIDCAESGNVCVAGVCKPIICEAGSVYCGENEVRQCGHNGGSFQLIEACVESEFCHAALGACVPDACTAGSPVCTGNVLGTCKNDGSGPQPGGTDCGEEVCDSGACRPLLCSPNARFCDAGDVVLCNALGTDVAPYDSCQVREFCDGTLAGAAACTADICPQGADGCSGERLATCNGDGSGVTTLGADCGVSPKVCDLSGACLAQALDELGGGGAAVPFAGSAIHFNLVQVSTARKVVELEAGSAPGSSPVTWIIYRSATPTGTFSRLTQLSVPTSSSGGHTSSGAIAVGFDPGVYYLVGFAVSGAHEISVREHAPPAPASFGVWLGGFSYVAGLPPTIPNEVEVGPGVVGDAIALRVHSAPP